MEYNFHKGDWVLSCAMPYPQYVKIKEEHTDIEIVADIRDEANGRITTAIIDWDELEPIPIEPAVLEAFGFVNREPFRCDYSYSIETEKGPVIVQGEDSGIIFYAVRPNEFTVIVEVKNIHEIQHAMRVARITKELEYKEK